MDVQILSLPATLGFDGTGFYATATFQRVRVADSPLVVALDPPVATVEEISYPAIEAALIDALRRGAVIL